MDKFLSDQYRDLDIAELIATDVDEMDSALPPNSVYKYYPRDLIEFFKSPAIRFTQKNYLNDAFELTKRWQEFASVATRRFFADKIKKGLVDLTTNKGIVLNMAKDEYAKKGIFLSPEQLAEATRILLSNEGRRLFNQVMEKAVTQVDGFIDVAFASMDLGIDQALDKVISDVGIFSVAEAPTSHQMWGLYASSGSGFVVEFNTEHNFFIAPKGNGNLLRKVRYTDERIQDFWRNPLYLFLVKNLDWSFEREWRMIKKLSECDAALGMNKDIHVCYLKPGMIKSVIFGYHYGREELARDGAQLLTFDPSIKIQLALIDTSSNTIEIRCLVH